MRQLSHCCQTFKLLLSAAVGLCFSVRPTWTSSNLFTSRFHHIQMKTWGKCSFHWIVRHCIITTFYKLQSGEIFFHITDVNVPFLCPIKSLLCKILIFLVFSRWKCDTFSLLMMYPDFWVCCCWKLSQNAKYACRAAKFIDVQVGCVKIQERFIVGVTANNSFIFQQLHSYWHTESQGNLQYKCKVWLKRWKYY